MKKVFTAILLFDMVIGLLFLGLYGMREEAVVADSGFVKVVEAPAEGEAAEVKKIAITFDGDVIIGLSQGICCTAMLVFPPIQMRSAGLRFLLRHEPQSLVLYNMPKAQPICNRQGSDILSTPVSIPFPNPFTSVPCIQLAAPDKKGPHFINGLLEAAILLSRSGFM